MPDVAEVVVKVFERAAQDEAYRAKLLADTHAAIEEVAGRPIPEGIKVVIHENTTSTLHFTLPYEHAADGELSDEELEQVAGGGKGDLTGGTCADNKPGAAASESLTTTAGKVVVGYSAFWD